MAAHPRAVNLHTEGSLRHGVVYVGRGRRTWGLPRSKYGNPFPPGSDGVDTLETSLRLYAEHLTAAGLTSQARIELAGSELACWCVPRPCHASLLAWVVDGDDPQTAFGRVMADQHPTLF